MVDFSQNFSAAAEEMESKSLGPVRRLLGARRWMFLLGTMLLRDSYVTFQKGETVRKYLHSGVKLC